MKLKTIILIGFLIITLLIILMAGVNYLANQRVSGSINQIQTIEGPLQRMSEQVISYDAILTGNADRAVLDAETNNFEEIIRHRTLYDNAAMDLDNLLKNSIPIQLEQSSRSLEIKNQINEILIQLNTVNIRLSEKELESFTFIDNGRLNEARELLVSREYENDKDEFAQLANDWSEIERQNTALIEQRIILGTRRLIFINLFFASVVILLSIIFAFLMVNTILKPLSKLTKNVDEITKGNLDIQLEKSNIFEVQKLTDSLNRILASLKLAILRTGATLTEFGLGEAIKEREKAVIAKKEAEKTLKESEEKYKILSQTAFEAIAIHDNGVLLEANDRFYELFGYNSKELLGKQTISLIVDSKSRKIVSEKIKTHDSGPYEVIGVKKDKTKFPMRIKAREITYKGKPVRIGAIQEIIKSNKSVNQK